MQKNTETDTTTPTLKKIATGISAAQAKSLLKSACATYRKFATEYHKFLNVPQKEPKDTDTLSPFEIQSQDFKIRATTQLLRNVIDEHKRVAKRRKAREKLLRETSRFDKLPSHLQDMIFELAHK